MEKQPPKDSMMIALGIYGAVGFQLAAAVVVGLLFGNWLDEKWDTKPWLALTGLILGAIGGFYNLIRILNWKTNKGIER